MKRFIKTVAAGALGVLAAAVMAPRASADVLSIDFQQAAFSNGISAQGDGGTGPWLNATFSSSTAGTVTLTLTASHLYSTEFVSNWYFNVAEALTGTDANYSLSGLAIVQNSGSAPTAAVSLDTRDGTFGPGNDADFKADGDGYFDFLLEFPTNAGSTFNDNEVASFTLTGSGSFAGITAASFKSISVDGGDPNKNGFLAAAHIQGIPYGEKSGFFAGVEGGSTGTTGTTVPLPAAAWAGFALLGGLGVKRRLGR
jgi:hypothetical protein